jgi:hypothetical protein
LFPLLILVEIMTFNTQYQYVSSYNRYSNMTSFKRFGSKSVVKYAYIGISTDRQCHNLFWQLYKNKYRICPIRIEIIHGGLNIYWFYHGLALYADILPFAIAQGKIFGIKGQPVVKSVYIQAPMNYFLNIQCHGLISVGYCSFPFFSSVGPYISSILSLK